jgi:DNA repair ATPase RecN
MEGLASLAYKIGDGTVCEADIDDPALCKTMERSDEIGQLAEIFNQMAHNVVKREEKLKQEVQQLRIEIDDVKRKQQVEEITGTEYFSELQKRAREMRRSLGGEGLTPGTAEG